MNERWTPATICIFLSVLYSTNSNSFASRRTWNWLLNNRIKKQNVRVSRTCVWQKTGCLLQSLLSEKSRWTTLRGSTRVTRSSAMELPVCHFPLAMMAFFVKRKLLSRKGAVCSPTPASAAVDGCSAANLLCLESLACSKTVVKAKNIL